MSVMASSRLLGLLPAKPPSVRTCLLSQACAFYSTSRQREIERRRLRYQQDSQFREAEKARLAEYYQNNKARIQAHYREHYQTNRADILEKRRQYYAMNRDAMLARSKDPEVYKKASDRYAAMFTHKYATDPEFASAKRAKSAEWNRVNYHSIRQRHLLKIWLYRADSSIREKLTWKTHKPVLYPERVEHHCAGCGKTRRNGMKLWWKRKSDPEQYDCHPCFASDWSRALPLEYEGFIFGQGTSLPRKLP